MSLVDPVAKAAYMKAYRLKNLERLKKQKRLKRLADPETTRALDRAAYQRKDKSKRRLRGRSWYRTHRKQEAARKHAQYLKDKSKVFERVRIRRAIQKGAAVSDLTAAQWREIKAAYGYRCVYCGVKTIALQQDHIMPLSKGGLHTASNIVPACKPCNVRKSDGPVLVPVQPLLLTIAPARRSA